jgi:hypothetical protein
MSRSDLARAMRNPTGIRRNQSFGDATQQRCVQTHNSSKREFIQP